MSDERIVSILNHIERSYGDCTLESIASDTGYSTSYLSSLIKQKTGKTFSQIKLNQQLTEAAYLLNNTERSVQYVARKVGTCHSFTQNSKKHSAKRQVRSGRIGLIKGVITQTDQLRATRECAIEAASASPLPAQSRRCQP